MTIEVPQKWIEEMNRWKLLFPMAKAAIAGGCLRDLDNNIKIKDVDIFLWSNDLPACSDIFDTVDGEVNAWTKWDKDYFSKLGKIKSRITDEVVYVAEYKNDEIVYNIVFLKAEYNVEQFMQRLDFGLSRIGIFDAAEGIFRHRDYVADLAHQQFVIRRCENDGQLSRSKERGKGLMKRYPGFTLVAPLASALPLVEIEK